MEFARVFATWLANPGSLTPQMRAARLLRTVRVATVNKGTLTAKGSPKPTDLLRSKEDWYVSGEALQNSTVDAMLMMTSAIARDTKLTSNSLDSSATRIIRMKQDR